MKDRLRSRGKEVAHNLGRFRAGVRSEGMEALKERGILRRNAPHLVHDLAFVVPNNELWEAPVYGKGMKV